MNLECLLETTPDLLPHTYLIDKRSGKMVAYQKSSGEIRVFGKPMTFEKRYRKFKKVLCNELVLRYTSG